MEEARTGEQRPSSGSGTEATEAEATTADQEAGASEQQLTASVVEQGGAIRKSELVNWYLEEIAVDTLQSEAELIECKVLVERIIDRLITKVVQVSKL